MGKHKWYDCIWDIKHIRDGKVIWEESKRNALVDQGERNMLVSYFRAENIPTEFYIRLAYDTIVETDTLSNISNEPSGNGYSAKLVERSSTGFPTIDFHEGDYRVTSKEVQFTASGGNIGPVNVMYLATTSDNSGKLLAFVGLSMERTINVNDTLVAQMRIKLK